MKNLRKTIRRIILESSNSDYEVASDDDFERALSDLSTLDLEDGQVRVPEFDEDRDTYIFQIGKIYIHIRDREDIPSAGPFELFVLDVKDRPIGFIRGTVSNKVISFNLIFINEENRGWGIGSEIYEHFLNDGYVVRSDDEITDPTYSLYMKLYKKGYVPLVFADGRVGLKKDE